MALLPMVHSDRYLQPSSTSIDLCLTMVLSASYSEATMARNHQVVTSIGLRGIIGCVAENYLKMVVPAAATATGANCVKTASEKQGVAATAYHGDC